jgi:hypothetical protein
MNEIRARMQRIAKLVDAELPAGYGFVVFCFKFNAPASARGEYASNARRKDVLPMLQKFIDDCPIQEPEKN